MEIKDDITETLKRRKEQSYNWINTISSMVHKTEKNLKGIESGTVPKIMTSQPFSVRTDYIKRMNRASLDHSFVQASKNDTFKMNERIQSPNATVNMFRPEVIEEEYSDRK